MMTDYHLRNVQSAEGQVFLFLSFILLIQLSFLTPLSAERFPFPFNTSDIEVYYEFDAVRITESSNAPLELGNVTYTLNVTNNGPSEATNVIVAINYHDETISTNRSFSTGYWDNWVWVIPSIPAGATVQMIETSIIIVPPSDKWVMASLQELDQDDPDSTPGDWDFDEDDADRLEILAPECDLDLTLAADVLEYEVYENINYEVAVQNLGPSIATGVSVSFPLPQGMVFTSSNATLGEYDLYYETWNIGTLDIGQTVILNLELFTLDENGPKIAFAQIQTADQPDPDSSPGNGTSPIVNEDDEAVETLNPFGGLCSGDITMTSQAEVNAFNSCSVWDGSITITGNDISDLSTFDGLKEITGSLTISELDMTVLDGFNDLETIGGNMRLMENNMVELNGFTSLEKVEVEFFIFSNTQLTSIQGFGNLEWVDEFVFWQNNSLTNLDAFSSITYMEFLQLIGNDALENIDGLSNIPSELIYIELNNVPNLENLNGLSGVTATTDNFIIFKCNSLTNLDALNNFNSAFGFYVQNNDSLTNIDGLSNLHTVEFTLEISNNLQLTDCCGIYPILSTNGAGNVEISNNPFACNSEAEVIDNCEVPTDYCTSESDFPWHDWIAEVEFVDINNPSGKSTYSDFTAQSTELNIGETYTFSLTVGYSYYTFDEHLKAWIDYNQDGDFNDPSEMVFSRVISAPTDGTPTIIESGPVFIPANVMAGSTRMRVSMKRGDFPEPCETLPFGEVEDYTVVINNAGLLPNIAIVNYEVIPNGYNLCHANPSEDFGFVGGTIVNSGTAPAGPFELEIFFSKDQEISIDDVLWQEFQFAEVEVNDAVYYTVDVPVPATMPPGIYYLIQDLDAGNQVMESNELDNVRINEVQIGAPDFVVNNVEDVPLTSIPGQSFNFTTELGNESPFPLDELSGTLPIEIYLSENPVLDTGSDILLGASVMGYGQFTNAPMYLNGTATAGISVQLPGNLNEGDYYLFVWIGYNCEITGVNNNSAAIPISIINTAGDYCESEGDFPWHDWIGAVTFSGIDNQSGKSKYSDFTDQMAIVESGMVYPVTLQANFSYTTYDEYWKIWIDYNQNNIFEEPEEVAFADILSRPANGTDSKQFSGEMTIPDDALTGTTRMRVSMKRGAFADPCEVFDFGEVEDYSVEILGTTIGSILDNGEVLVLDARLVQGVTELHWITNTSYKNDYFIIERSSDGNQFEPVFVIDNTKSGEDYTSFEQQDAPSYGLNYYRIKQYDLDGSYRYSNESAIRFSLSPEKITCYPNPAKDEFFIHLNHLVGHSAVIHVQDTYGRLIYEQKIESIPAFPVKIKSNNWDSGLYFISIKIDDLKLVTKKVLIQKPN